jgi:hypothetical protein
MLNKFIDFVRISDHTTPEKEAMEESREAYLRKKDFRKKVIYLVR